MLINLSDVMSDRHETLDKTVELKMDVFESKAGKFSIAEKTPVHVKAEHVRGKEMFLCVQTSLVIEIPCDRCLENVRQEFVLDIKKHVDLDVPDAELTEELDESNFIIDGCNLDIEKLLYNEILIGWPVKVLCREDCRGICSTCGQNLNEGFCNCEDTGLDPRMSVVRDLFKNFKEV
ncbi:MULTISPECIES: YceD family protein [Mediterraneibacter]|uniref:YceD family protein n=1 Tax=Mediterraneibacter TaxID=2316020 RepID=UPI0022E7E481|nr:DUF177 domain-containing protein [Mediterraneibacter massiliensis]